MDTLWSRLFLFLVTSDGQVNENGEASIRDAY